MSEFKKKIEKLKEGSYSHFSRVIDNIPWIATLDEDGVGGEEVDFENCDIEVYENYATLNAGGDWQMPKILDIILI